MAVDVYTTIIIERPADAVAAYAADPDNAPSWYVNIDSVEWETRRPLAVGSRLRFVARFLGRTLAYTYEVSAYTPGKLLVMRTAQGPFPMETTYTWAAAGKSTRMSLRNRGIPAGFARLGAPAIAIAMRVANRKDLARLRRIMLKRIVPDASQR
ncbi:SRPBCC family protein [Pseudonocardia sp. TRM90224]|uniref:SRPBCC family protein n=1 Tax=Pseudonocardia sp. TRM90224 TaxID=2812678 RepID=UPI001E642078|nr:SRPBCC family protein [Pseudonocardia sp. TRM90224]